MKVQVFENKRHKWIFLIITMAFVMEILAIALINRPWIPVDTVTYLQLAKGLSHFSYDLPVPGGYEPTPYRAPGFPILLWITLYVLKLKPLLLVSLFSVFYYISIILIAYRYFTCGLSRLLFISMATLYFFTAFYVVTIATEGVAVPLITLVTLIMSSRKFLEWNRLFLTGILLGISGIVRPDSLPLLAIPVALIFFRNRSPVYFKKYLLITASKAIFVPVIAALLILPFAAWNLCNFKKFSFLPVASASGKSLYIATWDGILSLEDLGPVMGTTSQPQAPTARAEKFGLYSDVITIEKDAATSAKIDPIYRTYPNAAVEIALDHEFMHKAIDRINKHPLQFVIHIFRSSWNIWNTQVYPKFIPNVIVFMLKLFSGIILTLGVVGAILSLLSYRTLGVSRVPLLMIGAFILIHLPLHTEARYTAPVRLLMLMYATALLVRLIKKRACRTDKSAANPPIENTFIC